MSMYGHSAESNRKPDSRKCRFVAQKTVGPSDISSLLSTKQYGTK